MKKLIGLAAVILTIFVVMPAAAQTPTGYSLITRDTGTAELSTEQAYSGLSSAKLATDVGSTDVGMVRFEYAPGFKLDDLHTFSYCEYITAREAGSVVDVFVDIWLDFDGDGDADVDDYPGYMQAEPYYTLFSPGASPTDTWICIDARNLMWSTLVGPDDPYHAPTIGNFQDPSTFVPCVHGYDMDDWTDSEDFGQMDILRVDVRVGYGAPWDDFTGYADHVQINNYFQSFETFDSLGDCISTLISEYCSGLTGKDRADCNKEQQRVCSEMFGKSVVPID